MSSPSDRLRQAWIQARQALAAAPGGPVPSPGGMDLPDLDRPPPVAALPRTGLAAMSRCINCGLCALVVRRAGYTRLPDLPGAYLRDPGLLQAAVADLEGGEPSAEALAAAAAVCPVGVPVEEVAAAVRRAAHGSPPPRPGEG